MAPPATRARALAGVFLVVPLLASGCLEQASPFCEEQGSDGSWDQDNLYLALRGREALLDKALHTQGEPERAMDFRSGDFDSQFHGDGWLTYVSWWTADGRRYMARAVAPTQVHGDGTTWQQVALEADKLSSPAIDPAQADVFLSVLTRLQPSARQQVVDDWMAAPPDPTDTQGRLRRLSVQVPLDLAASYVALGPGPGFPSSIRLEAPDERAGGWSFRFEQKQISWFGTIEGHRASLRATSDGTLSYYFANPESAPESSASYREQVAADLQRLSLPAPYFGTLRFRPPVECWFG